MSNNSRSAPQRRLPEWLKKPPGSAREAVELKRLLRKSKLHTVCEEARCPNISECFSRGTATFMILGNVCTRGCRFCSVQTGRPKFLPEEFAEEAESVAEAATLLKLKHVVVTSVARDDLKDGGASGFSLTISALRRRLPQATVEVLIPDFRSNREALDQVIEAAPDVLNHNLETVPRLYRRVRPGASYHGSLDLLLYAKRRKLEMKTKTGIMLGLGETQEEVQELMKDAVRHEVEIFTAGQYMQPTLAHLPVEQYLTPETFAEYACMSESLGFKNVSIGPFVRSSYHAEEFIN